MLRLAAARLDRAALAAGRAITRGLAETVLADLMTNETDDNPAPLSPHHPLIV